MSLVQELSIFKLSVMTPAHETLFAQALDHPMRASGLGVPALGVDRRHCGSGLGATGVRGGLEQAGPPGGELAQRAGGLGELRLNEHLFAGCQRTLGGFS